jgi:hypothetical protein
MFWDLYFHDQLFPLAEPAAHWLGAGPLDGTEHNLQSCWVLSNSLSKAAYHGGIASRHQVLPIHTATNARQTGP